MFAERGFRGCAFVNANAEARLGSAVTAACTTSRAWVRSLRDPAARRELDARIGWYILIGTIPIGIFGIAFQDQIETGARDLYLISVALILLGFVLLLFQAISEIIKRIGYLTGALKEPEPEPTHGIMPEDLGVKGGGPHQ